MTDVTAVIREPLAPSRPRRFLGDLERRREVFANLGLNWFASVMGTGIVANAAALPPMAMLTVGAGALLVGKNLIGLHAAVRVDEILWTFGTATGLLSAVAIPYLMFTEMPSALGDVLGSWLMPVVPPMVSAAAGAGLIRYLPAGHGAVSAEYASAADAMAVLYGVPAWGFAVGWLSIAAVAPRPVPDHPGPADGRSAIA
jgi:tellurite resistance protein TehA-like permease